MSTEDIFEPNKIVDEVTDVLRNRITELEKINNIPTGYLKTALALHIPRFTEEEIYGEGNVDFQNIYLEAKRLAQKLKNKIKNLPKAFQKDLSIVDKYSKLKRNSAEIIEIDIKGKESKVEFKTVNKKIGFMIQQDLHYIGVPREDTLFHFGLFRKNSKYPFSYSGYSILDRKYLYDALPVKCKMEEVLVLTRSFSINSSPINSMSLLFGTGINFIKENYPKRFKCVITAINPNTLFKGIVFKGSSFFPFATAPFIPTYYQEDYLTRKGFKEQIDYNPNELKSAQIDCKPIIWLGNGFSKEIAQTFKECKIINVSKESYLAG